MKRKNKKSVVLYHAGCPDGFGGAWAAWRKLKDKAEYIPVHHQTPYPKEVRGKDVYLVDFCYKPEVMKELQSAALSVTIIDHHKTSLPALRFSDKHLFALNHSGAVLSWKYFYPGKPVPKLLKYVEDTDIWKFKLPKSKEVFEAIYSYPSSFPMWNKLATLCESNERRKRLINEGRALLRRLEKSTENAVDGAEKIEFEGYKCLIANAPRDVSHLGHALVVKKPPIGIVWSRRHGKIIVSLRSNGKVDVAKIAEKYGGGGHKAAAGFSWEAKSFLRFPKPISSKKRKN